MKWGPGKLLFIHIASSSAEAMQELSVAELIKNKGSSVCLFGKIEINEWGGKKIPQIHIIDISASQNS